MNFHETIMNTLLNSIGKIELNLRSLEFVLRLFLYNIYDLHEEEKGTSIDFMEVFIDEYVPENYLSNYDSLDKLINQVNAELKNRDLVEQIDDSIVILRDTFAHGRVVSNKPEGPYRIIKFSKVKKNMVQVESVFDLTPEWISLQVNRTEREVQKIIKICHKLGLTIFPEE